MSGEFFPHNLTNEVWRQSLLRQPYVGVQSLIDERLVTLTRLLGLRFEMLNNRLVKINGDPGLAGQRNDSSTFPF